MNASSVLSANVQKVDLKKWGRVMIDVCFFLPIEEVISMRINLGKGLIWSDFIHFLFTQKNSIKNISLIIDNDCIDNDYID